MEENKKRIEWIDYVKAFACFLVVLGHILQSFRKAGIDNNQNITMYITWFIYLFHMPLFMCMSGILYSNKKNKFSWKQYKTFEIKKFINLIIPYVTFYLLSIGINMIFSNSVNEAKGMDDIMRIFNNPIAPYWFLYALISIFIIIPLLEYICNNNGKIVFGFLVFAKVISIFIHTNIYFLDSIMKFGIYFYVGYFFSIDEQERKTTKMNFFLICFYVIISIVIYIIKNKMVNYLYEFVAIGFALAGIFICIQIFKGINKNAFLDTFKNYTFQIFLLHTIFAAGIRIVLLKLGITNYIVHFIAGVISSIYMPVLLSLMSKKILYTNIFFYPTKTMEEILKKKGWNER